MSRLVVGDLCFELRHSARRRTLEIIVDRGGELVLLAPTGAKAPRLRDFVRRKRIWVYRQLARKEALMRPIPRKAFVDGEGFLYLGRSYRLRLLVGSVDAGPVRLERGRLLMPRTLAANGRTHLRRWYVERATSWLSKRVRDYADRMEVAPAGISVQDLGYRWGSCGKGGRLYFHWKTILLPARIAEYIVVHEMAHLHEPHHTPAFWRCVARAMPDYEPRKAWLAERGIDVEGL